MAGDDTKEKKDGKQAPRAEGAPATTEAKAKGQGKPGGKDKRAKEGAAAAPIAKQDKPIKRSAPPRLRRRYDADVIPALMKQFGYKNRMQVPRVEKIVVNFGLGEALDNPKVVALAVDELTLIAGQKPVVTVARKSIANFKLRQGVKIGVMVTLRAERMWEFFDRMVTLALPRVRDFKGVSPKSFDGRGNYTLGLKEQIIFPEINYDRVEKTKGMNISIVTTARTDDEGRALLGLLGMPFRAPEVVEAPAAPKRPPSSAPTTEAKGA
jgi:large subunit ribosomal protein L5